MKLNVALVLYLCLSIGEVNVTSLSAHVLDSCRNKLNSGMFIMYPMQ